MDSKVYWNLYDYHRECLASFRHLFTTINTPLPTVNQDRELLCEFREDFHRYKVWAANVGVGNAGEHWQLSLDFRLQDAAFLKSQVIRLIDTLSRTVKKDTARSLVDGTRKSFEETEPFPQSPEAAELNQDVTSEEDSPWDISDTSSDSACESNKEAGVASPKESLEISRDGRETFPTEMGQVSKSIKLIIECLYKLPLRKPATMDRVKGSRGRDMSLYQHFDVLYVKDKFPLAEKFLVHRLGKLISRRRQLLEYRVTHTQRLRPPVPHQMEAEMEPLRIPEGSNDGSYPGNKPHLESKSRVLDTASRDLYWNNLPSAITRATVEPAHASIATLEALYPPSITESRTSTATEYTENQKLQFPPRPLNEDGEPLIQFECPYCGIAKHIPIEPLRAWESHVLRDLQPYVCTFQECDMFDHMFERRQQWFNHELNLHRAKWSCNTCPSDGGGDSPYLFFGTKEGFTRHMTSVHKLAKAKLDRSMEAFRYPSHMVDGYCPLCKKYAQKLKSHLGRHMEQMALFALPRPSLEDSGSSRNALADCSHGSSRHLSSDPGEESLSSPRVVHFPIQNIAVGSLGEAIPDRDHELEPPKTPDPSTQPHLNVEEEEEYNTGFPGSVSNLLPSVALKLLEQNLQSLIAGSRNDSPPPPVSPSQQSHFLFVSKGNAPKGEQGKVAATMPWDEEEATQATVGNHGVASGLPSPAAENIAVHEESNSISVESRYQYRSLIRKFYSKNPPPISIEEYLSRLHEFCPMSSAVYLATSLYLQRLAVEGIHDINRRNIYRLVLASLRVSAKALEDLSYPHSRLAKVGGVSDAELSRLELAFCFLVGFDLSVTLDILQRHYEILRDVTEGEGIGDQGRAGSTYVKAIKGNA